MSAGATPPSLSPSAGGDLAVGVPSPTLDDARVASRERWRLRRRAGRERSFGAPQADARVEYRVEDVGDQRGDEVHDPDEQDPALEHRDVLLVGRP